MTPTTLSAAAVSRCAVIALLLALALLSAPSAARAATARVTVSPVGGDGLLSAGFSELDRRAAHCPSGSQAVTGAYLCYAGDRTPRDPCWPEWGAGDRVAVCLDAPWSRRVLRVDVDEFPAADPDPIPRSRPWGVTLRGGSRCQLVAPGPPRQTVAGRPLNYLCDRPRGPDALLGRPDRRRATWRIVTARLRGQRYVRGRTIAIKTAWYGAPATAPPG